MKTIKTQISADKSLELIENLQDLPGSIGLDFSVGFLLDNGHLLKFCVTGNAGEEKLCIKLIEPS